MPNLNLMPKPKKVFGDTILAQRGGRERGQGQTQVNCNNNNTLTTP